MQNAPAIDLPANLLEITLALALAATLAAAAALAVGRLARRLLTAVGRESALTEPVAQAPIKTINGFVGAYATTFFLTFSNPVTILSFVAIYAGWHVPDIAGRYTAAAILTAGVFTG